MTRRVCPQPGCPTLTTGGRCDTHRRQADQSRGTRTQRGYDTAHDRRRTQDLRDLTRNPGRPCPWCQQPMHPHTPLDWDHTKQGLTHAHCNRADGGRRAGHAPYGA